MTEIEGSPGGERAEETEGEAWAFARNVAVRALLDHVAEELAAEFVRLMRASVSEGPGHSTPEARDR